MSLWLTDDELTDLTSFKQNPKRVKALAAITPKVSFRVRSPACSKFEERP